MSENNKQNWANAPLVSLFSPGYFWRQPLKYNVYVDDSATVCERSRIKKE